MSAIAYRLALLMLLGLILGGVLRSVGAPAWPLLTLLGFFLMCSVVEAYRTIRDAPAGPERGQCRFCGDPATAVIARTRRGWRHRESDYVRCCAAHIGDAVAGLKR